MMKKGIFQTLRPAIIALFLFSSTQLFAQNNKKDEVKITELSAIEFNQKDEISRLELNFNSNDVKASKFHVTEDKQIIIDLKDVTASKRTMRAFDTSEFSGSIVFVSAYKKPNDPNSIRIALQLRDNVRSILKRLPNKIVLEVENRFGAFTQKLISDNQSFEDKLEKSTESSRLLVPKSNSIEDILENLTLSGRKKYIGKKISFNVKDVSVEDILKMIAHSSGFNIIITDEIKKLKPLTLNLTNIPWDQALDTILGLNKLVATKNGIILMVQTLEKATKDKELEAAAKRLAEKEEPLVTKVFPISYSKTEELSKILSEYLTASRGKLSIDERTNSIIVKDTPDVIEKLRKIIEVLDTQTPQVLIESKIVEVNEAYAKEIGLKQASTGATGLTFGYDPIGQNTGDAQPINSSNYNGNSGPGFSFSSAPTDTNNLFGLSVFRFGRLLNLSFQLQLMESESKGKIISSPKVITQNKKKATLKSISTTSYSKQVITDGVAETVFEPISAELNLSVTPQVTNEGSISLEIELKREAFSTETQAANAPPDKTERNVATNVLVENGSTIVLGGLYNYSKSESHSGIPFLKDIPLLGWLFRTHYNPSITKEELVIFLTPRIINQENAGLTTGQ